MQLTAARPSPGTVEAEEAVAQEEEQSPDGEASVIDRDMDNANEQEEGRERQAVEKNVSNEVEDTRRVIKVAVF